MPNRSASSRHVAAVLAVASVLALMPTSVLPATANEQSDMSVEKFLSLARRHVPLPEPEYGIEYEYLVVNGMVEDIRFFLRAPSSDNEEARAFNIATVRVARTHSAPRQVGDEPAKVDLALVHAPYHSKEGYNVFRGKGGGGDFFDRWHVGDYIVAVAVRTDHPTLQKVDYSGDEFFTNVFCVVRQGDTESSDVAVIGASAFSGVHKKPFDHRSTPWTMVDPSTYGREFLSVPLDADAAFKELVALLDEVAVK